jgi:hypothetical protein
VRPPPKRLSPSGVCLRSSAARPYDVRTEGPLLKLSSARISLIAFVAAAGTPPADAQQIPAFGCGAALSCSSPRGFSTLTGNLPGNLFSSRMWQPTAPEIRLNLPPNPALLDEGAIDTTTEIVLSRNPKLRENLAIAMAANAPRPAVVIRPGEAFIRIVGRPAPRTHRDDIPRDAFAAMALRQVSYPRFQPR